MQDTYTLVDDGITEIVVAYKIKTMAATIEEGHGMHLVDDGREIEITSVEVGIKGGRGIEIISNLNHKQLEHIQYEIEQSL